MGKVLNYFPSPAKILIVDSNSSERCLLKRFFLEHSYIVVDAASGRDALTSFKKHRPDIVLLDLLMSDISGFDVAVRIKALAGDDFIPIVFLTSLQDERSLVRCVEVGDDFLAKPYSQIVLQAKINSLINMRNMQLTLINQRDEITNYNHDLLQQQDVAKRVFDRIAHAGVLGADNIKYHLSPLSIFNGDVMLAGVSPTGNLVVFLGDFTGHGLHAAIGSMPLAQTFYTMLKKGFSLREIVREINITLCEILPVDLFCCAFIAEINFNNCHLRVWNAGLPDCVIYRSSTREVVKLASNHIPMGINETLNFDATVRVYEIEPGDRLYVWSDGIHEAQNSRGDMFGEDRLMDVFACNSRVENLFEEINTAVDHFIGDSAAEDDVSLLEITMIKADLFKLDKRAALNSDGLGLKDWRMRLELRPETLKSFDPLPLLLHILMNVPHLQPYGGQVYTVISELYSNSLEHGVLGLDSAVKLSSVGFTEYYQHREASLAKLSKGYVIIDLDYSGNEEGGDLKIIIEDSGVGFDYQQMLCEDAFKNQFSGRGIHLIRSLSQSLHYAGSGNKAYATFVWSD